MRQGFFLLMLGLVACTTNQPIDGTAVDDMTVSLHQAVDSNRVLQQGERQYKPNILYKALVPGIKVRTPSANVRERRFDIAVKDVPAQQFYMGLVQDTPINLAISPEVKDKITLNLKQVTTEQVLQTLENIYNIAYYPIPGGYEIIPNKLTTKIYTINYLELERISNSSMSMSSGEVTQSSSSGGSGGGASSGSSGNSGSNNASGAGGNNGSSSQNLIGTVNTTSKYNFWKELEKTLCNIVGAPNAGTSIDYSQQNGSSGNAGGNTQQQTNVDPTDDLSDVDVNKRNKPRSVTVNPLAGAVVVRAMPKELKQVEAYLDLIQNSIDRQVILEAKILEVTLNNQYQMGIDWKLFGANLDAIHVFPGTDLSLENFPNAFSVAAQFSPQDFTATIRALELQGNVQVLSSPKVATMNNQMAAIKVGTDEFFVTNISTNTTNGTVGSVGSVGQAVITPPTPTFTPFFSGITLDVTPQVDSHNNVTLHIHPAISLVKEQTKTYDTGVAGSTPSVFPFARSTIRESDTVVHAKNGQVVVIGGLMENQSFEDVAQLPVFGNIPFLGTLLRNTKQHSQKTELVILIRPTIVNNRNNNNQLIAATQRIAGAKRGFHIGGRPDIFGTEGEIPVTLGPASGRVGAKP